MIAFVLFSMLAGLIAGIYTLISSASILMAILVYAVTGFLALSAVLARALICQHIKTSKEVLAPNS